MPRQPFCYPEAHASQLPIMIQGFHDDRDTLATADIKNENARAAATGYYFGYAMFFDGCRRDLTALAALVAAHTAAAQFLMRIAESHNIDSRDIWTCGVLCRRYLEQHPETYRVVDTDWWPALLGVGDDRLGVEGTRAVLSAEATVARISVFQAIAHPNNGRTPRDEIIVRALSLKKAQPGLSDRLIAKQLGCSHSTLSRHPTWRRMKQLDASRIPSGFVTRDNELHAIDDE